MADNLPRIQASRDAQEEVKADAYVLKAEDDESEAEFDSRLKREFLAFVPLPIDPEITFMEVPSTCQESTFEAQEALRNFSRGSAKSPSVFRRSSYMRALQRTKTHGRITSQSFFVLETNRPFPLFW